MSVSRETLQSPHSEVFLSGGFVIYRDVLYVEAEQDDIAILHHIFFAFAADKAFFFGGRHRATGHQVVKGNYFRTDKSTLKIGVDLTGSLRRLGAFGNRPGSNLCLLYTSDAADE